MAALTPATSVLSFNQDTTCFVAATESKFTVYSVDPFGELFSTSFQEGKVAFVEMLFRSNILAVAMKPTEGTKPRLLIWDDNKNAALKELTYKLPVLGIKLNKEVLAVATETTTFVYNFWNFSLLETLETSDNKLGLLSVARHASRPTVACLGAVQGQVRVLVGHAPSISPSTTPKAMATTIIQAHHTNPVAALALSSDGSLLATASVSGTLIRVFNTETGQLLHELRRGSDSCRIFSIAFRFDSSYVACTSDKFHAHIFSLSKEFGTTERALESEAAGSEIYRPASQSISAATRSGLSSVVSTMASALPSFITAQRSFAHFRVPDCTTKHIIGFCADNASVAIACSNGRYFRVSYGGGGECTVLVSKSFGEA